jgi:hypothetical protein
MCLTFGEIFGIGLVLVNISPTPRTLLALTQLDSAVDGTFGDVDTVKSPAIKLFAPARVQAPHVSYPLSRCFGGSCLNVDC